MLSPLQLIRHLWHAGVLQNALMVRRATTARGALFLDALAPQNTLRECAWRLMAANINLHKNCGSECRAFLQIIQNLPVLGVTHFNDC
jgi:hypothetical protein